MKEGIKTALYILTGAIIGGGSTGIVTYKLTKKKFMKLSDERVKSLEDYIERLQAERLSNSLGYISKEDEKSDDVALKTEAHNTKLTDERLAGYQEIKEDGSVYTRYSQLSKGTEAKSKIDERYEQIASELEHPMDSDEDEDYISDAEEQEINTLVNSNSAPKVISYADYGNTGYLDEEHLYYYVGDHALVNDNEEIIPSPEDILGDCLETSGFITNNELELYVRNYRRSTDYEISKIHESYGERDLY